MQPVSNIHSETTAVPFADQVTVLKSSPAHQTISQRNQLRFKNLKDHGVAVVDQATFDRSNPAPPEPFSKKVFEGASTGLGGALYYLTLGSVEKFI